MQDNQRTDDAGRGRRPRDVFVDPQPGGSSGVAHPSREYLSTEVKDVALGANEAINYM